MKTGRLLDVLSGHAGPVHGLTFSPSNVSCIDISFHSLVMHPLFYINSSWFLCLSEVVCLHEFVEVGSPFYIWHPTLSWILVTNRSTVSFSYLLIHEQLLK